MHQLLRTMCCRRFLAQPLAATALLVAHDNLHVLFLICGGDVLACTAYTLHHTGPCASCLYEQQHVLWSWIHHGDTSGHRIHDSADTMVVNDGVCASHSTSCFQRPPVMYMRSGGAGGSRRVTACILLVLLELAPTYLD